MTARANVLDGGMNDLPSKETVVGGDDATVPTPEDERWSRGLPQVPLRSRGE